MCWQRKKREKGDGSILDSQAKSLGDTIIKEPIPFPYRGTP
jgi:hypothetical protein